MRLGTTNEGFEGLEQLARRDPSDPNIVFQATFALLRRGNINEALALTDRFAKAQPKSPLPHFYRGLVFTSQSKLQEAATAFGEAISVDPKFTPARFYRSDVSVARGDWKQQPKIFIKYFWIIRQTFPLTWDWRESPSIMINGMKGLRCSTKLYKPPQQIRLRV